MGDNYEYDQDNMPFEDQDDVEYKLMFYYIEPIYNNKGKISGCNQTYEGGELEVSKEILDAFESIALSGKVELSWLDQLIIIENKNDLIELAREFLNFEDNVEIINAMKTLYDKVKVNEIIKILVLERFV